MIYFIFYLSFSNLFLTDVSSLQTPLMKTSWLVFLQVCSIEDNLEMCPNNLEDMKIPTENCYPSAPPESLIPNAPPPEVDNPPSYENCVSEVLLNNQWTSKRASLSYTTSMPLCTGVIVNEKFIVTSAYCAKEAMNMVDEKEGNFLKIVAGAQSLEEPNRIRHGLAFHSESGYKHQGAQSLIGHDIGFITVDVPFIFVPGVVEWAKFPQENIKLKVGKECTVVGWGLDKMNHGTYALRQATVTILDNSVCQKKHYHTSEAKWKNVVCIGNPGADLKQKIMLGLGDFGSPLVCKFKQYDHVVIAGIAMRQDIVDAENRVNPIIYTKTGPFLDLFRYMVDITGKLEKEDKTEEMMGDNRNGGDRFYINFAFIVIASFL